MTLKFACNIIVMVVGILTAYMMTRPDRRSRLWGSIIGLIDQPAWFYIAIESKNHGLTALACWYTWCWIKGIKNNREKKEATDA